ncbi:MAG: hypothetical protein H8E40_00445 [Chloroflexi bacterium]|nr:hypothetical protein [Chloroflexota bacterium]
MAKDSWVRLMDTMLEIKRILGAEAMNHIINLLPEKDSAAANDLSEGISLGDRGPFKNRSETRRRKTIRAYGLLQLLLEGVDDDRLAEQLASVSDSSDTRIERFANTVWTEYNRSCDIDTLRTELRQFVANPVLFARRFSMLPCNGEIRSEENDYSQIHMDNSPNKRLVHKMVFSPKITASEYGAFHLTYAPKTHQSRGVDMYFLPWKSARIVSMDLQPGQSPSIFFTAAISGCSVFVEGQPSSPRAYHAGIAMTGAWPPMNDTVPQQVRMANARENPILVWRELYRSVSSVAGRPSLQDFKEVNKEDYVSDGIIDQRGFKTTRRAQLLEGQLRGSPAWRDAELLRCSPWGCVFGVRTNRDWTFYLQENVTLTYRVGQSRFATSRPIGLKSFYPRQPVLQPQNPLRPPETVASKTTIKTG